MAHKITEAQAELLSRLPAPDADHAYVGGWEPRDVDRLHVLSDRGLVDLVRTSGEGLLLGRQTEAARVLAAALTA